MNWSLIGILCVCLVVACLIIIGYVMEKRQWNGGKCPSCSMEWKVYDISATGGKGYQCPECRKTLWLVWSHDKESA